MFCSADFYLYKISVMVQSSDFNGGGGVVGQFRGRSAIVRWRSTRDHGLLGADEMIRGGGGYVVLFFF